MKNSKEKEKEKEKNIHENSPGSILLGSMNKCNAVELKCMCSSFKLCDSVGFYEQI